MKRALLFFCGILWFAFAGGFGFFLVRYLTEGAGLQFSGPQVSAMTVLLGLVHFIGLAAAALICFAIGAGFCARAIVRKRR